MMNKEKYLNIAGDLGEELSEIGKIAESEKEDKAVTHTSDCGLFLTIYCC